MIEEYKKKAKRPKIYDEFFPILSEDTVSKIWAKILINVLFIELCILGFINFTANEIKKQMPIAQFFYEIFEFFDFRKNKDVNGLLYTCIIVFLLLMTSGYGMLYLNIYFEFNLSFLSFSWEKSFLKQMLTSYSFMLMYPSVLLISNEMFCNDRIEPSDRNCYRSISEYVVTVIAGVIIYIFSVAIVMLNNINKVKDWINRYDYMSLNDSDFFFLIEVYIFIRASLDAVPYDRFSEYVYYVKSLFLSCYSLALWVYIYRRVVFQSEHIQRYMLAGMTIVTSLDLSVSIGQWTAFESHYFIYYFVAINTFLLTTINISILDYLSLLSYRSNFKTFADLKVTTTIILSHYISMEMTDRKKMNYHGIIAYHVDTCTDPSCFCKKKTIFDVSKNKMVSTKDIHFSDTIFMRYILTSMLRRFVDGPHSTPEAKIFFAEFLFRECSNVFLAHYYLNQAEQGTLPKKTKFKVFVLRKIIKNKVNPNEIGNKKYNFIEKVIKTEKAMHAIKHDMKLVLKNSMEFWREFKRYNNVNFTSFKARLEEIITLKFQLKEKWKDLEKYLKHNNIYMLYYKWFLRAFLNQEVNVTDDFLNDFDHAKEKNRDMGDDFDEGMVQDHKPFLDDTFIAHIRCDLINPGEIVSLNRSCFNFTGYHQNELIRQKINKLMPKVIAEGHDAILRQYISVGVTFTDNKLSTYMLLKDGTIKPVNIYIKLFYQVQGNIEMVGLFREIKFRVDNPEYIVFDNSGVINGMTRNLMDELGLVPSLFQQYDYNIMVSLEKLTEIYLKSPSFHRHDSMSDKGLEKRNVYEKKLSKESTGRGSNLIPYKTGLSKQATNRSIGSKALNDPLDRQNPMLDNSLENLGIDLDSKNFSLIFKVPFNIVKILEDFESMVSSKKIIREIGEKGLFEGLVSGIAGFGKQASLKADEESPDHLKLEKKPSSRLSLHREAPKAADILSMLGGTIVKKETEKVGPSNPELFDALSCLSNP